MGEGADELHLVKGLLHDLFSRVNSLVDSLTDADDAIALYRPDREANTVAWLLWHLIRIEDDHVSDLLGVEQIWTAGGWHDRFGLPFDAAATGYGHSADDVAQVQVSLAELGAYHRDVQARTREYIDALTADELTRVVDDAWDPPVTAAVRMVSVASDALQHLGQAAYLRGLAGRSSD